MGFTLVQTPPRTILEVFESLPEGTLCQVINNALVMSPAPVDIHQKVAAKIFAQLFSFVEEKDLGEVRFSPYDVHLDEENVFQPDIFYLAKENAHKIKRHLYGAPDLVIEILSPSNSRYDKEDKRKVYEKHGVKEYFIVEPVEKAVTGYYLVNDEFICIDLKPGVIESKLLGTVLNF